MDSAAYNSNTTQLTSHGGTSNIILKELGLFAPTPGSLRLGNTVPELVDIVFDTHFGFVITNYHPCQN